MRNTDIEYYSMDRVPVVLPEMAELLPPLTEERLSALEIDLLKNGCYLLIIVNKDTVIVDGYNQHNLCEKRIAAFSFEGLLEAKQ